MRLEASRLSVRYGAVEALVDVTMTAAEGGITTVIGANGAGKSTFLNACIGLVPVASGTISLDGQDITRTAVEDRAALGMTLSPEGRRLFPDLTVHENLLIGAYSRGRGHATQRDLEKVYHIFQNLARRRGSLARNLSGGEQQMCAIGRALMSRPGILLLDEPTLGLAPVVVHELARLIREIHASGVTIVLVEQNSRLALSLADAAYVLEVGRVSLSGSAQSLLHDERVQRAYLGA